MMFLTKGKTATQNSATKLQTR